MKFNLNILSAVLPGWLLLTAIGYPAQAVIPAQAGMPDWYAANLAWAAAGLDSTGFRTGDGSALAWSETYTLQTFNLMYAASGDTIWLQKLALHGLAIRHSAKDLPEYSGRINPVYADGFRGWGNSQYSGEYEEYLVWDGHFCTELAKFVRTVYENENLQPQFGARADTLLRFLEQHVAAKWYSIWDAPRVAVPGNLATNDTYHRWIGGKNLQLIPVNRFTAFANFLLELSRIAHSERYVPWNADFLPWYDRVVSDAVAVFRSRLHYDATLDAYLWAYAGQTGSNDLSHSSIEVGFAFDCFQNNAGFSLQDMARFAHTLTRYLWKNPPDFEKTALWDFFDKTENSGYEYDPYCRKWVLLGLVDPLACGVVSGVMREMAERRTVGSGVFACPIAGLAWLNQAARPLVILTRTEWKPVTISGSRLPAGSEIELYLSIANLGLNLDTLAVTVKSADPRIELIRDTVNFLNLASVDTVTNHETPFLFRLKSDLPEISDFPFLLEYETQGSVRTDSFSLALGPAATLLVDDDAEAGFESFYREGVLDQLGPYHYWNVSQLGSVAGFLSNYERVIWFTGDQTQTVLNSEDRMGIRHFLDQGGKLLLFSSGAESALLDSTPDSAFFESYLHARPNNRKNATTSVVIKPASPEFFPSVSALLKTYKNKSFRAINPAPDATPVFKYTYGDAGILTSTTHQVAYLTFGLENIDRADTEAQRIAERRHLLGKLLEALDAPDAVSPGQTASAPRTFQLQYFPNPFREQITLEFQQDQTAPVEIYIFNIQGQLVRRLNTGWQSEGPHRIVWDGRNQEGGLMGSGIYFIRIQNQWQNKNYKICYLK